MASVTREMVVTTATVTMRDVRLERELSLRDVEKRTGIGRGMLSKIERGIELPRGDVFLKLCDCYGIPPERWHIQVSWVTES